MRFVRKPWQFFGSLDGELTAVLTDSERSILMASLLKVHHHLTQSVEASDRSCPRQGNPRDEGDEGKEKR